jgi:hypothetical protein
MPNNSFAHHDLAPNGQPHRVWLIPLTTIRKYVGARQLDELIPVDALSGRRAIRSHSGCRLAAAQCAPERFSTHAMIGAFDDIPMVRGHGMRGAPNPPHGITQNAAYSRRYELRALRSRRRNLTARAKLVKALGARGKVDGREEAHCETTPDDQVVEQGGKRYLRVAAGIPVVSETASCATRISRETRGTSGRYPTQCP